ncbi:hypothetical protein D1872_315560 [compost metagenome]
MRLQLAHAFLFVIIVLFSQQNLQQRLMLRIRMLSVRIPEHASPSLVARVVPVGFEFNVPVKQLLARIILTG